MGIVAKKGGNSYEPLAAGNYAARCISMIHVGTIEEEFKGVKKWMDKVILTWEIPDEQKEFTEGKGLQPYVFSKDFTLSMYEKAALRKYLEGWRGKAFTNDEADAFDITALIGKTCLINIIHTEKGDKTYANISGVSAMPKGMTCLPQINPTVIFNVDEFDQDVFDKLHEFVQNKIKRSKEYERLMHPELTHEESDEVAEIFPSKNSPVEDDSDLPF